MLMPNRHASSENYRYGFQGQERDDEVKGAGNSVNYKYRMHDPRLGRFFAVDPLTRKYPHYTPYSFSGNKVIAFVELEGLEEAPAAGGGDGGGASNPPSFSVEPPMGSVPGAQGTTESGRTWVNIDRKNPAKESMWQIAGGDRDRLEKLYEWNPGTRDDHNSFDGGERIYTSAPLTGPTQDGYEDYGNGPSGVGSNDNGSYNDSDNGINWGSTWNPFYIFELEERLINRDDLVKPRQSEEKATQDGMEEERFVNYGNMPINTESDKNIQKYSDGMSYDNLNIGDTFESAKPTLFEGVKIHQDTFKFIRWNFREEGQKKDYVDIDANTLPANH